MNTAPIATAIANARSRNSRGSTIGWRDRRSTTHERAGDRGPAASRRAAARPSPAAGVMNAPVSEASAAIASSWPGRSSGCRCRRVSRDVAQQQQRRDGGDRHVDEEDRAPAEARRSARRRAPGRPARPIPDAPPHSAERAPAVVRVREGVRDQGQRARHQRGGAGALDRPRRDQRGQRAPLPHRRRCPGRRSPGRARSRSARRRRSAERAGRQQQRRERERVAVDDPLRRRAARRRGRRRSARARRSRSSRRA